MRSNFCYCALRSHPPDGLLTGFQGDCQEWCDHIVIQQGQDERWSSRHWDTMRPKASQNRCQPNYYTYALLWATFQGQLGQLGLITKMIRAILYSYSFTKQRTLSNINKHTYKTKYLQPISFLFSAFVSVLALAVVPSGSCQTFPQVQQSSQQLERLTVRSRRVWNAKSDWRCYYLMKTLQRNKLYIIDAIGYQHSLCVIYWTTS